MGFEDSSYDGWLDKYFLETDKTYTVVELGCGFGDDTSFLAATGHKIISCDISDEAVRRISERYPGVTALKFDMSGRFPIRDGEADIVVASLCLHYFCDEELLRILSEIRRIMKSGAVFLCRLNSVRDYRDNGEDKKLSEPGLYLTREGMKRFFDEELIKSIFANCKIGYMEEAKTRKFSRDKTAWELMITDFEINPGMLSVK